MFSRVVRIAVLAMVFAAMGTAPAQAYLDAGSVSMMPQIIVAGLAAAGVTVKIYWHRIQTLFRGSTKPEPSSETVESPSERE